MVLLKISLVSASTDRYAGGHDGSALPSLSSGGISKVISGAFLAPPPIHYCQVSKMYTIANAAD